MEHVSCCRIEAVQVTQRHFQSDSTDAAHVYAVVGWAD